MSRRRTRRASVINFTTGRSARATRHRHPRAVPVLVLDFGATSVRVAPSAETGVSARDVEFACQLADQAAAFAREITRMHAGRED